ncbi:MAG: hypothetical protein AB1742_11865 [bacterium]
MDAQKRREDFEADWERRGAELLDDIFGSGTGLRGIVRVKEPSGLGAGEVVIQAAAGSGEERAMIMDRLVRWAEREENWIKLKGLMLI